MNSVSWFLYAADVLANLKILAGATLVGTAIMWGLLNLCVLVTEGDVLKWEHFGRWWKRGVITMFCAGSVYAIFPSNGTIYAIAASQVGEKIVTNESVQGLANDATKALHQWIKRQIEER